MARKWFNPSRLVDPLIERSRFLRETGEQIASAIHQAILAGGTPVRRLADVLHGVWLGHPLHPILTDVTIGAWLMGGLFDVISLVNPSRSAEKGADTLVTIGAISAVPTAITGMTDYSGIKQEASPYGLLHAMLNTSVLGLMLLSLRARRAENRTLGIGLSALALGIATLSAWLGGHMVYHWRVGVNHSEEPQEPKRWRAALPAIDLIERQPRRIEIDGQPVLLFRENGEIHALSAVCAHAGGPLEQGKFYDGCVQCPWHDSVFKLSDGGVVHGPSTYPQPAYEVRVLNGQIEVSIPVEASAPVTVGAMSV